MVDDSAFKIVYDTDTGIPRVVPSPEEEFNWDDVHDYVWDEYPDEDDDFYDDEDDYDYE